LADRTTLAGGPNPGNHFLAYEGLRCPAALQDRELHQLHSREPLAAGLTGAPTTNGAAIVGDSTVQDSGIGVATVRAMHRQHLHQSHVPIVRPRSDTNRCTGYGHADT